MMDSQRTAAMGDGTIWGGAEGGGNGSGRMSPNPGRTARGGRGARRETMVPGRGGRGRMFLPRGGSGRAAQYGQYGARGGRGVGRGRAVGAGQYGARGGRGVGRGRVAGAGQYRQYGARGGREVGRGRVAGAGQYGAIGGRAVGAGQYGARGGRGVGRGRVASAGQYGQYGAKGGRGVGRGFSVGAGQYGARGGRGAGQYGQYAARGGRAAIAGQYGQYGARGSRGVGGRPGFGRGRGRAGVSGRGGRGRGMPMVQGPPSKLDVFNRYVGHKIITCLTREDQELLGLAYPRLAPAPLTEQQQMMMAQKKMFDNAKKEFESHKVYNKEKKHKNSDTKNDADSTEDDSAQPKPTIETEERHLEIDNEMNGDDEEKTPDNSDTNNDTDSTVKEDDDQPKPTVKTEEKKEKHFEVDKVTNREDEEKKQKNSDTNNDSDSTTKEDDVQPKPIIETKETSLEVGKEVDVGDGTDKSTGKEASVGQCEMEDKAEDESEDEVCLLSIDADETIPDPVPGCDCEICSTAKNKKECNCEVCRTNRVKAIQTCDCDRCSALRNRLNRVFNTSEQDCNCKKCRANKLDPTKTAELMKVREENMRINMSDCDTLLAQLNTKRLYRRIKYYKREDKHYNVDKAYPYQKNTVQMAEMEWGELLEDYKLRRTDLFPDYEREKPKKENKNDDGAFRNDDPDHEYEYVGDKPSKYELLMFTPCPRAVAVLASYPRSGNSLMRNLYEKITLRVTGSDMMGGLQKHDLVGEMATGTNNVQFVKTHYPERMGAPAFPVSRAVLLVRNPYDALDSYFNLMSTNSHTKSVTKEERKKYAHLFADMARKEILVWRDFHEFWLKQKIPLLVIRYEDLIRWTSKVIGKVVKFVLEVNSMTFFEDRIQCAIGEDQIEKLGAYKARSGGIGKSLTSGNYSPQLLNEINYGIVGTMEKFGYKEMLIPKPSDWRLEPLDQLGVVIPGTGDNTMVVNNKGLVRGPNRHTNWQAVKQEMENGEKPEASKESAKKVSLF